jgi:hypothetical protein
VMKLGDSARASAQGLSRRRLCRAQVSRPLNSPLCSVIGWSCMGKVAFSSNAVADGERTAAGEAANAVLK